MWSLHIYLLPFRDLLIICKNIFTQTQLCVPHVKYCASYFPMAIMQRHEILDDVDQILPPNIVMNSCHQIWLFNVFEKKTHLYIYIYIFGYLLEPCIKIWRYLKEFKEIFREFWQFLFKKSLNLWQTFS